MSTITFLFIGLVWWPGQQPEAYVVPLPDKPACVRLERSFTISVFRMNFDTPPPLQAIPLTDCKLEVKPTAASKTF